MDIISSVAIPASSAPTEVAPEVAPEVVVAPKKKRTLKVKPVAAPVTAEATTEPTAEPTNATKKRKAKQVPAIAETTDATPPAKKQKKQKAAVCTDSVVANVVAPKKTKVVFDILTAKYADFKSFIDATPKKYNTLNRYRTILTPDMSANGRRKLKTIEEMMQVIIDVGHTTQRRVANTGTRETIELVYKDTVSNQKLNRVGQKYTKVVYTGATFEDSKRLKMRRRRRNTNANPDVPHRTNLWIEAIGKAKVELETPKLVIVRKVVSDPTNEKQIIGHKVYLRAKEIIAASKLALAEAAVVAAAAAPVVVPVVVPVEPIA